MKNRSQKRTLSFERLETKATPAALLFAIAPLDDVTHERVERAVQDSSRSAIDASANWQFSHSVCTMLQFVNEHTLSESRESEVCAAPTWDQCHSADEMMKLHDRDLRALVMAERFATGESPMPESPMPESPMQSWGP